jgi:hypothetical protein
LDEETQPSRQSYQVEVDDNGRAILPAYDSSLKQKELQLMLREYITWHWSKWQQISLFTRLNPMHILGSLGGKHVQWKILAQRTPDFIDDDYLPRFKKDHPPFVFCDPCRWSIEHLKAVWTHWETRQKKKTRPFRFNQEAVNTVTSKGRSSTNQVDEDDDVRTVDDDRSASTGSGSEDMEEKVKDHHPTTSNTGEHRDNHRGRKLSLKQLKVMVKDGRVRIDEAAGFAEDPKGTTPLLDVDEQTASMGPPEPGQQRLKIRNGQASIDKSLVQGQKDVVNDNRPDETPSKDSPFGTPLSKIEFLKSLCHHDDVWKGALEAIDKIPVCYIFLISMIVIQKF